MTKWHLYEGKETLDYSDDGNDADSHNRPLVLQNALLFKIHTL
jgi:hypothetical protein